ncbi:tetraspanin 66E isoform X2 [Ptiloglossa arizonensis]|uniref:tetraspanin 66E isoform X2 n=1 Tax=Ptiloglossa arizonensis TaxID=3350558 RepID=UPI003FA0C3AC
MACTSQCAKYFLCFFNFVFFVTGGTALAIGIWFLADIHSFVHLIGNLDQSNILSKTDANVIRIISYILIMAGALTFLLSFLGYCGAMFESRCLLCICVAVGLAYGLRKDVEENTKQFLKFTITYYASNTDKEEAITVAWNGIMNQFHCCGVENYLDFRKSTNWISADKVVPETCCIKENNILKDPSCPISPTSSNSYYKKGCYEVIIRTIEENAAIVISITAGLAFIEILVIIMALHLACCYWRPQHEKFEHYVCVFNQKMKNDQKNFFL